MDRPKCVADRLRWSQIDYYQCYRYIPTRSQNFVTLAYILADTDAAYSALRLTSKAAETGILGISGESAWIGSE